MVTLNAKEQTMTPARKNIDRLADQIVSLGDAEKVKLLSRLMEAEGIKVDWSVVTRIQRNLPDTPALWRSLNQTVREVRRARRAAR